MLDILKSSVYEVKQIRRHVAIYDNGFAIFTTCFKIKVLIPEEFKEFEKFLDVSDNCKDFVYNFHRFEIKEFDKKKRFEELQFWWKCDNPKAFNRVEIDREKSNSNKLVYKFIPNSDNLRKGEILSLVVTISVPCAFPLENGYLCIDKMKDPSKDYITSRFAIVNDYKSIEYNLAIYSDIHVEKTQVFLIKDRKYDDERKRKDITSKLVNILDNFYNRKTLFLNKPKKNDAIEFRIKIKKRR